MLKTKTKTNKKKTLQMLFYCFEFTRREKTLTVFKYDSWLKEVKLEQLNILN